MNCAIPFLSLLGLVTSTFAQAPATQPAQPITGKLGTPVQVFNGKDLSGWTWFTNQADSKVESVWTVKDGVMRSTGKPVGYLRADKVFGPDYVLTIEYRHVTEGGGAFLFGIDGADKLPPKAMHVVGVFGNVGEVVNFGAYNWFVDNERYRPRDRLVKMADSSERPLGEWNVLEIVTDHGNMSVIVNGVLQNQADGMDDVTGRIGLQTGGAEMEFRKVQITPIVKR